MNFLHLEQKTKYRNQSFIYTDGKKSVKESSKESKIGPAGNVYINDHRKQHQHQQWLQLQRTDPESSAVV